jgi:hypothetical protein
MQRGCAAAGHARVPQRPHLCAHNPVNRSDPAARLDPDLVSFTDFRTDAGTPAHTPYVGRPAIVAVSNQPSLWDVFWMTAGNFLTNLLSTVATEDSRMPLTLTSPAGGSSPELDNQQFRHPQANRSYRRSPAWVQVIYFRARKPARAFLPQPWMWVRRCGGIMATASMHCSKRSRASEGRSNSSMVFANQYSPSGS